MNFKNIVYIVVFLTSSFFYGQKDTFIQRKNSVDITIAGTGIGFSANYSRIMAVKEKYFVVASVGVGLLPSVGGVSIPHQITFNFGKHSSFFEAGIGGVFWSGKSDSSGFEESINSYNLLPLAGWRKYFKKNLFFRAYASPVIHISGEYFYEDYAVMPYMGVSLGYTF